MVTAGSVRSTCPARSAAMSCPRQRLDIDLEADGQRGRRIDRRNDFVHPQHIGPQLLVAEGVVAKNRLPSSVASFVIVVSVTSKLLCGRRRIEP